jgi:hypothetical protein
MFGRRVFGVESASISTSWPQLQDIGDIISTLNYSRELCKTQFLSSLAFNHLLSPEFELIRITVQKLTIEVVAATPVQY